MEESYGEKLGNEDEISRMRMVLGAMLPSVKPENDEPLTGQYELLTAYYLRMQDFIMEHPNQLDLDLERWSY